MAARAIIIWVVLGVVHVFMIASPLEKSANLASGLGTHLLSTIDYDSK